MGAKFSPPMVILWAAALIALGGCTGGLKRLAPPGILKYEELAKGQPVDPAIEARIKEHGAESAKGFPVLAEQPDFLPEGIAKPEREVIEVNLLEQRDALNAAVEADRALAEAEREDGLIEARDALSEKVIKDDARARAERGLPPRLEIEDTADDGEGN